MPRRTSLVSLNQISDINMTPLMDLTFILLITFIITFPLIEQGVSINLPKGKATPLEVIDSQSIAMNKEGELFLNDIRVGRDELAESMTRMATVDPDVVVWVRADEALPYGRVMDILRLLHDANVTRMSLVTREE